MIRQNVRTIAVLIVVMALWLSACTRPKEQPPAPAKPHAQPAAQPSDNATKATVPDSIEKEIPPPPEPENTANKDKGKEKAAKINFADLQGKRYREADLRGKVVLLVYWATWCPPCRVEVPVLNKIHETYPADKVLVLAVSQDEKLNTLKDFLANNKVGQSIKYPVVYGADYVDHFGMVPVLPTLVLVDKTGNVIGKHEGTSSFEMLAKVIDQQL